MNCSDGINRTHLQSPVNKFYLSALCVCRRGAVRVVAKPCTVLTIQTKAVQIPVHHRVVLGINSAH